MKNTLILLSVLTFSACSSYQSALVVPAQQRVELRYPKQAVTEATLHNTSQSTLQVGVLNDTTQIRGFGLGNKATATVLVEADNQLVLVNESKSDITVKLKTEKADLLSFKKEGEYVNFTLRNNSAKSIPLIIPSVMNPNLSPFSKSGVGLKIGQEIFFKEGGKRYVLLTVDNTIQDGDVIEVSQLLKDRKKELEL